MPQPSAACSRPSVQLLPQPSCRHFILALFPTFGVPEVENVVPDAQVVERVVVWIPADECAVGDNQGGNSGRGVGEEGCVDVKGCGALDAFMDNASDVVAVNDAL